MKFKFLFLLFIALALCQPTLAQNPNQPVWKIKTNASFINQVAFSPDNNFIATVADITSDIHKLRIYNVVDGSLFKEIDAGFGADYSFTLRQLSYSKTGKYIVYAGTPGIMILENNSFIEKRRIENNSIDIAFSPDETILASGENNAISFWNIETGELIKRKSKIVPPDYQGNTPDIFALQYSPDGTHIAFTMSDGKLRFLNLANDSIDYVYNSGYGVMTYSNDGSMIAFKTGIANYAIQVMDVATKKIIASLPGIVQGTEGLAFSVDGKYILFSNPNLTTMKVFEINPLKLAFTYPNGSLSSISLSNDGKYFATNIAPDLILFEVPWNITSVKRIQENQTRIYPIPSKNLIEFDYANNQSSTTRIKINNLEGKFIQEIFNGYLEEGLRKFQISTEAMPNGIYFINVEQAGSKESFKFIIEK